MALPMATTPPQGLGMDETGRQEYFDALNKTLQALEARGNGNINLWNVAGQFFNPGRTGQFSEALGNAATSVGKDMERQQEAAIPLAQMRATIAGQKYTVGNETKALALLANALDTTPQQAGQTIASGEMTPDMISKIPSGLYVYLNKLDPKLGEGIKNAFTMDVERRKLVNEDIKNGLSVTDLTAKYGRGVEQYLPSQLQKKPSAPSASSEILAPKDLAAQIETDFGIKLGPAALTRTETQQKDLVDRAAAGEQGIYKPAPVLKGKETYHEGAIDVPRTVPESYLNARGYYRPDKNDPVHAVPMPARKTETSPATANEQGLPLAVQADVQKERAKAQDETFKTQRTELFSYTPQMTVKSNQQLKELHDIADKYPRIYGLMQQQGTLAAIQAAAQEGITLGRVGSISLPVQTFLEKVKLAPEEQRVLRRAAQLMAEQFFETAKAEKSALGPQISNADAQFMQRPLVTEADAASTVKYWTEQRMVLNHQRGELFKSASQFDQKYGTSLPAGRYFNSPDYLSIVKKYDDLQTQLRARHPDFGAK